MFLWNYHFWVHPPFKGRIEREEYYLIVIIPNGMITIIVYKHFLLMVVLVLWSFFFLCKNPNILNVSILTNDETRQRVNNMDSWAIKTIRYLKYKFIYPDQLCKIFHTSILFLNQKQRKQVGAELCHAHAKLCREVSQARLTILRKT